MAQKKKFYAVKNGMIPGIYETWEECEVTIKGYPKAEYKGFPTRREAEIYLYGTAVIQEDKTQLPEESELFAYVDGSFHAATGVYGYGVVLVFPDGTTEELYGSDNREDIASMRNVAGELKGAMIAMQYAVNQKFRKLTVFHDYEGIAKWANGEWKANLDATRAYQSYTAMIRGKIALSFFKVAAHTGVVYNERADLLAKKGAGISEE